MRKQYFPQVMYKKHRIGKWSNVMFMDDNGGKQYASSLEEAERAIENAKNRLSKTTTQICGRIGVDTEPSKDDTFEVVNTRIRVREVTEWEEIE